MCNFTQSSGTRHFTYDDLQRLIAGGTTADPESYTYDEVGNRTISHLSTAHTHDIANRILEDNDFTYTYDANGNLETKTAAIGGEVTTYTYDSFDRLTQVSFSSGVSSSYRYDALGRRIEKNADGVITRYVYDGQDILLEYDGSNVLAARYNHGQQSDQPLSMERGGQRYFYQADHLGSVRKIANASGGLVSSYDYDAYGRIESSVEGIKNPYGYTGREIDAESGLYHYRARAYDPNTGRFLQKDPIGLASGDNNPYRYVFNSPTNLSDPSGNCPWCIVWGAVALWNVYDTASDVVETVGVFRDKCATFGDKTSAALGLVLGVIDPTPGNLGKKLGSFGRKAGKGTAGSIRNVNPSKGTQNCVNCSIATDATLAGRPASALPGGPASLTVLEKQFGNNFKRVSGRSEIESIVSGTGSGTRGIVFGARGDGIGHVFNVVNQKGRVRFLDGQTGNVASFDGFTSFQFLRTN